MMPTMTAFRDPIEAPLRKLSVDLIKTYKHINEVRFFLFFFLLLFNHIYISNLIFFFFRSAWWCINAQNNNDNIFLHTRLLFFFFSLYIYIIVQVIWMNITKRRYIYDVIILTAKKRRKMIEIYILFFSLNLFMLTLIFEVCYCQSSLIVSFFLYL